MAKSKRTNVPPTNPTLNAISTNAGNLKSHSAPGLTMSHPLLARDGVGFSLYVLTDAYRCGASPHLDIREGDTLIFRDISVEKLSPDACILARTKGDAGGLMLLHWQSERIGLLDMASGAAVQRDSVMLLGTLVQTRRLHMLTGNEELQGEKRTLHGDGSAELTGLAQMVVEEALDDDGENVVWPMSLLRGSEVFAELEASFRKDFESTTEMAGGWGSREEEQSYALRLLCGRMMRAGRLSTLSAVSK